MFLIYGGNGWIGQKIVNILESTGKKFTVSSERADDVKKVEEEILRVKPSNVLCLIGRTHGTHEGEYIPTIDYLEKKGKIKENVRDNLFCPVALALLCKKHAVHLTYLGTGCIFTYQDDKVIFKEEDEPNFFGSSYSVVKGYTDRLMHMFDNVLNVRIRMPITSDTSPRNFIMKLLKYKKICSIQNSMTVLDELLPIMCDMAENKEVGTINLTNPGTIEHSEILDMYRKIVDPTFKYELFSYEDQSKVIACDRSNNELDTSLITNKYKIKNIKDSVKDILQKIKHNAKTLVIYCYRENEETKDNLDFFIRAGVIDNQDYQYVFIINDQKCTVDFPKYSNIRVHNRVENQNDMLTYKAFIETCDISFLSLYSYFYFINSSCVGPFMPPLCNLNWIESMNLLLKEHDLVGPVGEVPPDNLGFKALNIDSDKNIPYIHSYMFGLNKFGFNICRGVLNDALESKIHTIQNTERKLSSSILMNGGKIKSLLTRFKNIDLADDTNWDTTLWNPPGNSTCYEVPGNYFGIDLNPYEIIFVKNIRNANETRSRENSGISDYLWCQIMLYKNWFKK